ncbi:uncharacterized protein MONBRDRAFT_22533 [Monosiga brevicollis MX1]|uniref:Beta-galactosidase n=1 Tax=Monosiga brevicollis TaxID=81824 RepID=A9UQV3_MONBE|nr:uncharacterized protein MONBRDRAFT_22533 [Monosiga brevicollis MX1]EDQ92663.1 predicted protein [Monosiga brevicollis MX1]|eukprot:XP_001742425.1 hypothetical protein [Monosiga brevicollis MX1]
MMMTCVRSRAAPALVWTVLVLAGCLAVGRGGASDRAFTIANDQFLRDGQPFQILSASVHYSRMLQDDWSDRLQRIRALGFNAIETYVPWNYHNAEPSVYDFAGNRNLTKVKLGPLPADPDSIPKTNSPPPPCLIRGEWEFGGFPAWLLGLQPRVTLRTYETGYITQVDKWWKYLLPKVKPLLYGNGGPVIMMQIENEFGSYGNVQDVPADRQYMEHLVALARTELGSDVILYTTDGSAASFMNRGTLNGSAVLTLGDFQPNLDPAASLAIAKAYNPPGLSPSMCTEFYSVRLRILFNLQSRGNILDRGRLYHRGTTHPCYDYNAPLDEAGHHGYGSDGLSKFAIVQNVLRLFQAQNMPLPTEPAGPAMITPGPLQLNDSIPFLAAVGQLADRNVTTTVPCRTEDLGQNYGFTVFSTVLAVPATALIIEDVRDRAIVYLDDVYQGTVFRVDPQPILLHNASAGATLTIVLENMGRINFGPNMTDPKGILGNVTLDADVVQQPWTVQLVSFASPNFANLPWQANVEPGNLTLYQGQLVLNQVAATFIDMTGWSKACGSSAIQTPPMTAKGNGPRDGATLDPLPKGSEAQSSALPRRAADTVDNLHLQAVAPSVPWSAETMKLLDIGAGYQTAMARALAEQGRVVELREDILALRKTNADNLFQLVRAQHEQQQLQVELQRVREQLHAAATELGPVASTHTDTTTNGSKESVTASQALTSPSPSEASMLEANRGPNSCTVCAEDQATPADGEVADQRQSCEP